MRVLIPVFVREFYLSHTGFFLLVIAFAGGFMRSADHIALAEFFISSPPVLTIPILLWLVYSMRVMNFNSRRIEHDENEFIYCFMLFGDSRQWWMALRILFIQLLPVLLYGLFLSLVALKYDLIHSVAVIASAITILIALITHSLIRCLHHPGREQKFLFRSRFLNQFKKPFPLFSIEWLMREELIMILGTKVVSAAMIFGTTALYNTDAYDLRLLSIGIIVASGANTGLIHALHRFENFHLAWLKGLPIHFSKRVILGLTSIGIILLPEIFLLVRHFPQDRNWYDVVVATQFLVSIPILSYGLLYTKDRDQQEAMILLFYCGLILFMLVLFKIPTLLLGVLNTIIGLILWKNFYYSFEYISRK